MPQTMTKRETERAYELMQWALNLLEDEVVNPNIGCDDDPTAECRDALRAAIAKAKALS